MTEADDIPQLWSPRTPGKPVDVRVGDNRHIRSSSGAICVHYGWYSPQQVKNRRAWAEKVAGEIRAACPSIFKDRND